MVKNSFLKCPFNYIGGKHKLLPQLFNLFPKDISTFVDMFGGGFNVGININANKLIYNDQITPLVELYKYFQSNTTENILNYIHTTIKDYNIKKEEKEGFLKFREAYNKNSVKNPLDLYILISFSFNYQIRFNNSREYNCPHGTNRSSFTTNMEKRLISFIEKIQSQNIEFYDYDFKDLNYSILDDKSLVYCDPPYLITNGSYNDGNRGFKNWTLKEEKELLNILDELNKNKIKFALSNVTEHDGKMNDLLIDWIKKNNYNVETIKSDYSNSNYQKNSKNSKNDINSKKNNKNKEVLVYNFKKQALQSTLEHFD
ncbi:MAG: Dam family site-specific DNA-(adenine-N6)-methyltransferase [Methanobrevibacter sp.]|jgi:DNA adenine methylase Dam|nr:Dam family site-specific DNA-(adenine-N6)-methyltransferase [Candidatus Methanoflexus mossambicus]